ncbi:hypothetical protein, partial [Paenibacillus tyrfis]|uniref:hypothetical protein n=1 Tax=Paenibacillus tyrfis TaxID=1501230 RepID=UPI001C6FC7C9
DADSSPPYRRGSLLSLNDKYVRDKKASDYNEYLNNIGKADDYAKIAKEKSSKGYAEWSKNVQNF